MARKGIMDMIGATITADAYPGKSSKYLAELRHRLRRAEKGLCSVSGCKVLMRPYCDEHRERFRIAAQRWRDRKKTKGDV